MRTVRRPRKHRRRHSASRRSAMARPSASSRSAWPGAHNVSERARRHRRLRNPRPFGGADPRPAGVLHRRRPPLRDSRRGRRRHSSWTTTPTTPPRSRSSPPRRGALPGPAHRRAVPAAHLRAHALPARRAFDGAEHGLSDLLPRLRPALPARDLRRARSHRRRHDGEAACRRGGVARPRLLRRLSRRPPTASPPSSNRATSSSPSAPATSTPSGRWSSRGCGAVRVQSPGPRVWAAAGGRGRESRGAVHQGRSRQSRR